MLSRASDYLREAPAPPTEALTLIELLRYRAINQPNRLAYSLLDDNQAKRVDITYGELDQKAQVIAALLQSRCAANEPVLLLYPPGLEFISALFGCLYAGAVCVPAYPPRLNHTLVRLQAIAQDCQARIALTTASTLDRIERLHGEGASLPPLLCLTTDDLPAGLGDLWSIPDCASALLAILQYTSGSTGTPKGVMLSHNNLLKNSTLLARSFGYDTQSHCVSWLPLYHDMGLIGGVLQPLYGGFPCTLMQPISFLQRPVRWLEAISSCRATISGGPNFAYNLCVKKTTPEQRLSLNLSSWSVAFNGSEPIRAQTLEKFAEAFEPSGFRCEAFLPCYGLAEATLFVAGGKNGRRPLSKSFDARLLESNLAAEIERDKQGSQLLTSCGEPGADHKIITVNPESLARSLPGEIGEIWVSGPSIAQGYWNRPDDTRQQFQAFLPDTGEGPFLRTGDLGFINERELFITGRRKDLIIIRGLNHYPQDIEQTVQACHPALRPNCGAAFSAEASGEERLVVVQELDHHHRHAASEVIDSIRKAVADLHELQAYSIILVKPGSVPKTSSGKIQRSYCRAKLHEGSLQVIAQWQMNAPSQDEIEAQPLSAPPQSKGEIAGFIASLLSTRLRIEPAEIDLDQPIAYYGLDSILALELMHNIEMSLGVSLPFVNFLKSPSVNQLAEETLCHLNNSSCAGEIELSPLGEETAQYFLSYGQQALWYLHQIAPESSVYNISVAVRIQADLNAPALVRSLQVVANRHASLRASFTMADGEIIQRVHDHCESLFRHQDASGWDDAVLNDKLSKEANRPFDLEHGPLLRVILFTRSASDHVLLLSVHHIAADFWSLQIILQELGIVYSWEKTGVTRALPPPQYSYIDYVR